MALPAFVQGFIHGKWNLYVIVLISFAVYANTLFFDFVLDDRVVFTENQYVQKGLAGIPEIFGKETFAGYFKDSGLRSTVSGGRYRPLTLGFFALQNQIAGNNAFLAHLLNVLFFCLMNVVLFKSLSALLKYRFPEHAVTAAFLATLLFAVHPIHTEVVANVKGLDEIWALGFSLLALNSILNAPAKNNSWSSYAWAGLWFMLAMFSKENAFVFIALIPLSLILFTPYTKTQMLRTMTSLGLGAVLFMTCRIAVVGTQFMQESKNFLENPFLQFRGERLVEMLPADRYGTILYTFLRYVYLHVFPYPLTHDYAPKSIATHSLASPLALAGLVLAAAMVVLALMWRKSKPVYSWSILVFILALLPTSNLFFSVGAYMGERFAFVSSVGFCLALAYWTSAKLLPRSNAYLYAFGMILVLFAGRTVMRNTAWKDNMTLFNTDYRYSSNSAKLNSSLGFTMLENYRNQTDKESHAHLLTQAIFHLKKAGEIYPKYADCFFLLGNAYYLNKEYKNAVETYEHYIQLNPADVSIMKNYQKALREYGRHLFHVENNNAAAKVALLKSLKLKSDDDQALELLGCAEAELGYLVKSLEYLLRSTEINPNSASAWANLYITYTRLGDKGRAQVAINKGMEIDKDVVKKLMSVRMK